MQPWGARHLTWRLASIACRVSETHSMQFDLRLPAIALVAGCMATTGEALTIFRLGGADVPEPDLEGKPFDFVQLYWEDVDDSRFGASISLDLQPGSIVAG